MSRRVRPFEEWAWPICIQADGLKIAGVGRCGAGTALYGADGRLCAFGNIQMPGRGGSLTDARVAAIECGIALLGDERGQVTVWTSSPWLRDQLARDDAPVDEEDATDATRAALAGVRDALKTLGANVVQVPRERLLAARSLARSGAEGRPPTSPPPILGEVSARRDDTVVREAAPTMRTRVERMGALARSLRLDPDPRRSISTLLAVASDDVSLIWGRADHSETWLLTAVDRRRDDWDRGYAVVA